MYKYELPLPNSNGFVPFDDRKRTLPLPRSLLIKNALWFCYFRWIIIVMLASLSGFGLFLEEFKGLALGSSNGWALAIAGILTAANLGFHGHVHALARTGSTGGIEINLWAQISLDLLVLTFVVHFVGSLDTYVPFVYLFHIVLACIFFAPRKSFMVTLIACILYVTCVLVEAFGFVPLAGIYQDPTLRQHIVSTPSRLVSNTISALGVWFVVWYLASHLSAIIQGRSRRLATSIRHLREIQEERKRHMLRTTHELKAPFAAIHANTQLLLKGYCGDLPDEAQDVLLKISDRSRRLTFAIQEMLQLANLRSSSELSCLSWVRLDLADSLEECIEQIQQIAQENLVVIEKDLHSAKTLAVEDHVRMLLLNLLSNAIQYSHKGGRVQVRCVPLAGNGAEVSVEDHGIGIPKEKLPHVFDEYYRTEEAVRHNRGSTGLGLSIARHVAESHDIHIRVESRPNVGTKFILRFPVNEEQLKKAKGEKEKQNGVFADN